MIRMLPSTAQIIYPAHDPEINRVLDMGCWSDKTTFATKNADWTLEPASADYTEFRVKTGQDDVVNVKWSLLGEHNAWNAVAAMKAAAHVGVAPQDSANALIEFKSVKRRLECILDTGEIKLYDDFAHHPTAITLTLRALRAAAGSNRIIAVMEPRSNTMRMGVHADTLAQSLEDADKAIIFQADNVTWDIASHVAELGDRCEVFTDIDAIVENIAADWQPGDHIVIMSNGGFGGIHDKLTQIFSTI